MHINAPIGQRIMLTSLYVVMDLFNEALLERHRKLCRSLMATPRRVLGRGLLLHTLQHDREYNRLAGLRSFDLRRHELHGVAAQLGLANLRCSDGSLNQGAVDRDRNLRTSKRLATGRD